MVSLLGFLLALIAFGSHCVQSLKCPRACVCVRVCWGMRSGWGSLLTGVAASLQENLPSGGTNSTLTLHANPDHPPRSHMVFDCSGHHCSDHHSDNRSSWLLTSIICDRATLLHWGRLTSTFRVSSHFSNCPVGLRCQFPQNVC